MTAAALWQEQLKSWAIPQNLLDAVPFSPYEWPADIWRRRAAVARASRFVSPTHRAIEGMLPDRGRLLDIGAGAGRVSLPFARRGCAVTAVEKNSSMATAMSEIADESRIVVKIVEGSWPEAAGEAGHADVAVAANVLYDVPDIGPFLEAMNDAARIGCVLELTEAHPWMSLAPHYRALHGLERPTGPTASDAVAVVVESLHIEPAFETWKRPAGLYFESWSEIEQHYGRRLVLPRERWPEIRPLLETDVTEREGKYWFGEERRFATLSWTKADKAQAGAL